MGETAPRRGGGGGLAQMRGQALVRGWSALSGLGSSDTATFSQARAARTALARVYEMELDRDR